MDVFSELKQAQLEVNSSGLSVDANKVGQIGYKSTTAPMEINDGTQVHKVLTDKMVIPSTVAFLSDTKGAGADGGTNTAGIWETRALNTEVDPSSFVTLSSNQFTLPAGTYLFDGRAPASKVGGHKAKLKNITDDSDAIMGSNAYSSAGGDSQTDSFIMGHVTIADTKTFEIQHYTSVGQTDVGYGSYNNSLTDEVYTQLKITRIA